MDAAASGSQSKSENATRIQDRILPRALRRFVRVVRGYVLLKMGELLADVAGQQVDASRRDLAELDVDAAGRFEHSTQDGPPGC